MLHGSEYDSVRNLKDKIKEDFSQKYIYPEIWANEEKESLQDELLSAFEDLKTFYHAMVDKQKGVIVSIY